LSTWLKFNRCDSGVSEIIFCEDWQLVSGGMCSRARNFNSIGQINTHAQCSYFKTFFERDNLKTISKLNLLSIIFSRDFKIEYLNNNLEFFFIYYKFNQWYTFVYKPIQIQKINLYNTVEPRIYIYINPWSNWRFWSRTEESGHSIFLFVFF